MKSFLTRIRNRFKMKRSLRLTTAGRWYLGLTILLGVAAISSGNNILYLLESLILGGLILSGVLSEWALASIDVRWKRKPAIAGKETSDVIRVTNRRRIPLFCLEFGEWIDDRFESRAFLPFIAPRQTLEITARNGYPNRGRHKWEAIGSATRYPFGFAKKLSKIALPGNRLVWPSQMERGKRGELPVRQSSHGSSSTDQNRMDESAVTMGRAGSGQFAEGEVRQMDLTDDYSHVVWTLSAKRGEPLVRVRRVEEGSPEVALDLRVDSGAQFERQVSQAAEEFYRRNPSLDNLQRATGTLILIDWDGTQRVEGARESLDKLAMVSASGSRSR